MSNRAIFLDRDGTLNYDPGYLKNPEEVVLFPNIGTSLAELKNYYGYILIVITNQAGVARGLMAVEDVENVNAKVSYLLSLDNAVIDKFYYCPHHPLFTLPGLCDCRKPSPKMVFDAQKEFDIDLENSFFIGDNRSDILCGKNAGLKTILVLTGLGKEHISPLKKDKNLPNFVVQNISEACSFIKLLSPGVKFESKK